MSKTGILDAQEVIVGIDQEDVDLVLSEIEAAAARLNTISDAVNASVARIDAILKRLNVGIEVWIEITKGPGPAGARVELGYAKTSMQTLSVSRRGPWAISLRTTDLDEEDEIVTKTYGFQESPRNLRLVAIPKIPLLIVALKDAAVKMIDDLTAAKLRADEMVKALEG